MPNAKQVDAKRKHKNRQRRLKELARQGREQSKRFKSHSDFDAQSEIREFMDKD